MTSSTSDYFSYRSNNTKRKNMEGIWKKKRVTERVFSPKAKLWCTVSPRNELLLLGNEVTAVFQRQYWYTRGCCERTCKDLKIMSFLESSSNEVPVMDKPDVCRSHLKVRVASQSKGRQGISIGCSCGKQAIQSSPTFHGGPPAPHTCSLLYCWTLPGPAGLSL